MTKRNEKIERMRIEKLENNKQNYKSKPEILEKSKEIFEKSTKDKAEVHNRLYNDKFERDKKGILEKEKLLEKERESSPSNII